MEFHKESSSKKSLLVCDTLICNRFCKEELQEQITVILIPGGLTSTCTYVSFK